jgi:hypothetical protein
MSQCTHLPHRGAPHGAPHGLPVRLPCVSAQFVDSSRSYLCRLCGVCGVLALC